MSTPIERAAALTVGVVESVSPAKIRVALELDAPHATALNTGSPTGFPRINGYVLIPNETGAVVGMVVWLGIEGSILSARPPRREPGLIDLPFPVRKLDIVPFGTLKKRPVATDSNGREGYKLSRGIVAFPSVGDPVLLPTAAQLISIVEAADDKDRRVKIGNSPLASNANVTVDPDKLFGRHLAVLGNTGSGKSCSVAGIIRWAIEASQVEASKTTESEAGTSGDSAPKVRPNARFIILDPNDEYTRAFDDLIREGAAQVLRVPSSDDGDNPFILPAWMWNSHEWSAFTQASAGVQRPLLLRALRDLKSGKQTAMSIEVRAARLFRCYRTLFESIRAEGPNAYTGWPGSRNCGELLVNMSDDAANYAGQITENLAGPMSAVANEAKARAQQRHWETNASSGYNSFSETDISAVLQKLELLVTEFPQGPERGPINEDTPVEFNVDELADHIEVVASEAPGGNTAQHVATLVMRIRMMLADRRLGPVINPKSDSTVSLRSWLTQHLGTDKDDSPLVTIVDLSLLPSDVLHTAIAVTSRLVFEAAQRYRGQEQGKELPTVLVLEEAHTFVKSGSDASDGSPTPAQMCRQTIERIAREGRKFGLGLVLSSQRPSELSPTVLAQCNTFLLHRIVNDKDQELVGKLVPDSLGGLLKELPSLPSRQAILLGWAAPIPTLVDVNELPDAHRPQSSDPKFWDVWTRAKQRPVDWKAVADDWSGVPNPADPGASPAVEVSGKSAPARLEEL